MIKVGDTAEVIEVTDNSAYPILYDNGAWGTLADEFPSGACSAHIGTTLDNNSTWHVANGAFRKVGKLIVKELKHG